MTERDRERQSETERDREKQRETERDRERRMIKKTEEVSGAEPSEEEGIAML